MIIKSICKLVGRASVTEMIDSCSRSGLFAVYTKSWPRKIAIIRITIITITTSLTFFYPHQDQKPHHKIFINPNLDEESKLWKTSYLSVRFLQNVYLTPKISIKYFNLRKCKMLSKRVLVFVFIWYDKAFLETFGTLAGSKLNPTNVIVA